MSWFAIRLLNILSVKGAFTQKLVALQYFTVRMSSIELNAVPVPADLHVCLTWKTFEKAAQKSHFLNLLCKHGIFNMD